MLFSAGNNTFSTESDDFVLEEGDASVALLLLKSKHVNRWPPCIMHGGYDGDITHC